MENQPQLLKWRISNIIEIANALYINDADFLAGSDIDKKLNLLSDSTKESYCYKVQGLNGSLIGFFCVPKNKQQKKLTAFYIKPNARVENYIDSFWSQVSYTLYGEVYESINPFNSDDFESLLVKKVTIKEPGKYFGVNYNLNY